MHVEGLILQRSLVGRGTTRDGGLSPGKTDVTPRYHEVQADETFLRLSRVFRLNML